MKKQSLVQGAAILGVAAIIVKLLGALFRLPLVNWIGDTGMANYGPAYYIYAFFLILATAGIPIAISRLVSESRAVDNHYQAHEYFRVARNLMFAIGLISFIILFVFAPNIAELIKNPDSALAMRAIAPSLLVVPLLAAYRGYFQGMQNMKPTAVSQIVEQFFRVVVGLVAAYVMFFSISSGFFYENFNKYERGAAGASFGATAGSIGGFLMIYWIFAMSKKGIFFRVRQSRQMGAASTNAMLKRILIIAIPITVGAAIMPIINLVDAGLVMSRLQVAAGFTQAEAKSLYGQLSGLVGSLINFPQAMTQAIAMSLVPMVAGAYKVNDYETMEKNIRVGLRMSVIIGFPAAVGLLVLAQQILLLLYPAQKAAALSATPVLMIMAVGVAFLATTQTLTGVLQGVGKQMLPVRNLFIGVLVKIVLTYILTGIPSINVKGTAFATVVAYFIASVLNIIAVKKYTGVTFGFGLTYIRPLIASLVMGASAIGSYKLLFKLIQRNSIATLLAVFIAVVVYAIMVFLTGAISVDELDNFPYGDKIKRLVNKVYRRG